MGWREIRQSEDPEGVIRAQFERYYNGEMEQAERSAHSRQPSPGLSLPVCVPDIDLRPLTSANNTAGVIADVATAGKS